MALEEWGTADTGVAPEVPQSGTVNGPLRGLLVIALEQAVAAPYCSSRLADAGARVIKIERPEGDFARGYDTAAAGESSYFVWTNRGKESIALDLRRPEDHRLLHRMIARADVFLQNLAPGAAARMGFASAALRQQHPRLITCDVSGYGESGPLHRMKAYDLLVQAESGLVAVSGAPGDGMAALGRIGVSLCDISAGLNALVGIQQALLQRALTGRGSGVQISLFDSAAELMSVPYLQARYGGKAPERVGLKHPSIAPYGAYTCADGRDIIISIQNEREWGHFCHAVLRRPDLPEDPRASSNAARVAHRPWIDGLVADCFASLSHSELINRLEAAQTAFGSVNEVSDLIEHPQLRTRPMPVAGRTLEMPAPPWITDWDAPQLRPAPQVNEHGAAIRAEFADAPNPAVASHT